ncbi:hypothetical protein PVK06_042749 [Gossypium arboreum]|uniref:Uncharacterized protein n=1 Tax=Gossypium arboreum TaxID=29729 RepID=A0ABR0MNP2_GOSAR|nr:hypothetical protein PVK06_042749 [Gossypium arboreum]
MEIKCGVAEIQKDRNTPFVSKVHQLPNEKEAVYGALDKWVAWETEFPFIDCSCKSFTNFQEEEPMVACYSTLALSQFALCRQNYKALKLIFNEGNKEKAKEVSKTNSPKSSTHNLNRFMTTVAWRLNILSDDRGKALIIISICS